MFLSTVVCPDVFGTIFRAAPYFGVRVNPPAVETAVEIDIEDESRIGVDFEVMLQKRVHGGKVIAVLVKSGLFEVHGDEAQSGEVGRISLTGLPRNSSPEMGRVDDFPVYLDAGDAILLDNPAGRKRMASVFLGNNIVMTAEKRNKAKESIPQKMEGFS